MTKYKYNEEFSGRLAVICSDERFVGPTLKFLDEELKIESCDLIILPGGPEFIFNGEAEFLNRMDLLVKAHGIKEIILISHEDCGYYNKCFSGSAKDTIDKKILDDLKAAVKKLEELYPGSSVRGYYCEINVPGTAKFIKAS
jgi:hypothetical protein